jgi:hypothetical protein
MKKTTLFFCLFCVILTSCTQNIEELKKAYVIEDVTIEQYVNHLAGTDGIISWFSPSDSTITNQNYKLIGVQVKNLYDNASFIFMVDKSQNMATFKSLEFHDKIVTFSEFGMPDDEDTFREFMFWSLKDVLYPKKE